ncbi:hypothetical protein N7508_007964 [Penicillium antarcticum]|uniref:uncharacterized protein n=1 Tax=Penicillium antarcticum TaxID=416450 RepID=UPI0023900F75|nr:uncharacterized protein N7508_007964 [Penicillium antarcticum]KAJ5297715.1 hypothetical protein N7508_007964 [Penicillium antarcticum]
MISDRDSSDDSMFSNIDAPTPNSDMESSPMPIAIIGMGCRFPGDATNPEKLWDLLANGRSAWSPIKPERFHTEAWYHPDQGHIGTSYVIGAHYLTEDITHFDASFFNFSADVAKTMDPEVRLQLETVYEALENAGLPVEQIAGTNVSVFAGTSFRDNHDNHMRDPISVNNAYFVTGNGAAMVANRVSHFYDLRGPSVMVDTGCSTSLTLLHLACQSLRTGESTMAIVGGSGLLLNPDMFIAGTKLGIFSREGKCFAFDSRADGYGRGDGIASIVLKPLADAVRDGDAVRAVIRNTGINQDGRTTTITSPSADAQRELMETCYQASGLDPVDTGYVEAHGTGTQTGDLMEATAVGKVFGAHGTNDSPVLIGSVKTNIGHTEATSGLAGVIKVVMALEKGLIPPHINFENPNPNIPFEDFKIQVPLSLCEWPSHSLHRASVNNFGYGGANAHAIIEHPRYLLPETDSKFFSDKASGFGDRPRLFVLSAKDKYTVETMRDHLFDHLTTLNTRNPEHELDRLAFTLGEKRSRFPWTLACAATSLEALVASLDKTKPPSQPSLAPARSSRVPRLGFVFTGQGAQWYAMGRELALLYPVFMDTLICAQECLHELGAPWFLIEELMRDESSSHVNEVDYSLPLVASVQMALVDLLKSWGIRPTGVTGHSSGEVSAAYAARFIDLKYALAIVYYRGVLTTRLVHLLDDSGGMIAVGLGREDAQERISRVKSGILVVGCVNSPVSVTVSGDTPAIVELEAMMVKENIFARRLKVTAGYHSHLVQCIAEPYLEAMAPWVTPVGKTEDSVIYSSSTTSRRMNQMEEVTDPAHWVRNAIQPVEFVSSLHHMCVDETQNNAFSVDAIIEVGPHAALGSPIRQCLAVPDLKGLTNTYASCLVRGQSAVESMHALVCKLIQQGYPVDLGAVNFPHGRPRGLQILRDLPPYPWNHQTKYWWESRLSKFARDRTVPPHDLLGCQTADFSPLTPTWRHIIRPRDIPWVRDHIIQSSIVYPAAGYIAMVIEVLRQSMQSKAQITGYKLEDIDIARALVLEDDDEGVDVRISLRACVDRIHSAQGWNDFHIQSLHSTGKWILHCQGRITVITSDSKTFCLNDERAYKCANDWDESSLWPLVRDDDTYQSLKEIGLSYGPMFQNQIFTQKRNGRSTTVIRVPDTMAVMPCNYQQSHVIHPTTLDTIFQSTSHIAPSVGVQGRDASVPKSIASLYISADISSEPDHWFKIYARLDHTKSNGFGSSATVYNEGSSFTSKLRGSPVLIMQGLFCQSVGGSVTPSQSISDKWCFSTVWKPDLGLLLASNLPPTPPSDLIDASNLAEILQTTTLTYMAEAVLSLEMEATPNAEYSQYFQWMKDTVKQNMSKLWNKRLFQDTAESRLIHRMGQNLPAILTGKVDPAELMREIYTREPSSVTHCTRQVQQTVEHLIHRDPSARLLEIGAGRGECTRIVLDLLENLPNRGVFCGKFDVADAFAEHIDRLRVGESADCVEFHQYDVDRDPTEQGFETNCYDLIIASPQLYLAHDLQQSMAHVRGLLKGHGRLMVWGPTLDRVDMRMVYETLPAWRRRSEIEGAHLLSQRWTETLEHAGFDDISMNQASTDNMNCAFSSITLATAPSREIRDPIYTVAIVYARSTIPTNWLQKLSKSIADKVRPTNVTTHALSEIKALINPFTFVVFLGDLETTLLDQITAEELENLKFMCSQLLGTLWVSRGAQIDCYSPFSSLHHGLLRTLRHELAWRENVSLDLDPTESLWGTDTVHHITRVLHAVLTKPSKDPGLSEREYAVRSGVLQIPRIYEDFVQNNHLATSVSRQISELRPFAEERKHLKLASTAPGLLQNLTFVEDLRPDKTLSEDFVELKPMAYGLNSRDVMAALGQIQEERMGFECSGVLTRVGPKATAQGFEVGDCVYTLTAGCFATTLCVNVNAVAHLPNWMTIDDGASLAMAHSTAYHSLFELARLQSKESILIHSGSEGVGQSAIMMAENIGAEIFVTVGSTEKRKFISENYGVPPDRIFSSQDASFVDAIMAYTAGRGVDVVLNSLAGPLLRATLRCVARFGRFIEIGKRDIEDGNSISLAPFARCISFFSVDLWTMYDHRPDQVYDILRKVAAMVDDQKLSPIRPIVAYSMVDLESAFRAMQEEKHIGKIVLRPTEGDVVKVLPSAKNLALSSEGSYLIVGGLGGIGKLLARALVNRGARHIILTSRSAGSPSVENQLFVKSLVTGGANVVLKSCDVANKTELAKAVAEWAGSLPPIKGVIQGAMVLRDSIFESMSHADYTSVIQSKVQGSWNLHELVPSASLEFFIMLSSLSGVAGNTGQANYAAGGTFQDALARHRASLGLPGVSIDLGMVRSVGVLAEPNNAALANHLENMGPRVLDDEMVIRLVESAIHNPCRSPESSQIITALPPKFTYDTPAAFWSRDVRFVPLKCTDGIAIASKHGDGAAVGTVLHTRSLLAEARTIAEAQNIINDVLVTRLAKEFGRPETEIDPSMALTDIGVDSLIAVELRNWVVSTLDAECSIFDVMQSSSLTLLVDKLVVQSRLVQVGQNKNGTNGG